MIPSYFRGFLCLLLLGGAADRLAAQDNILGGTLSRFQVASNPWTSLDKDGNLAGMVERYIQVDGAGTLNYQAFAPSVDAADLMNRGVIDLLMIDSLGYVRYFPNSGTKTAPKFTTGIILPISLPQAPYYFQLADVDGDGKPDIVLGDGAGKVYVLRNLGGREFPLFDAPAQLEPVEMDLRQGGKYWFNFVSPAYANWIKGAPLMDLVLGDGTYASDNIYYLKNTGSNNRPKFDDRVLLIPGNGRQYLTARPCFWTQKDRPDLLVGDVGGDVTLYPNDTGDADALPKFKAPVKLSVNGNATFAPGGHLAVADLNGDGNPDLLWCDTNGKIWASINTGTPEAPQFSAAAPLNVSAPQHPYAIPQNWVFRLGQSFHNIDWPLPSGRTFYFHLFAGGFFYFLHLVGINPQEAATYEDGFQMPPGSTEKYAMKFEFMPPPEAINVPFPPYLDPENRDQPGSFLISYSTDGFRSASIPQPFKDKTAYRLSFQIKGEGFTKLEVVWGGGERWKEGAGVNYKTLVVSDPISLGSTWNKFESTHTFTLDKNAMEAASGVLIGSVLYFQFTGQGTFYITDLDLRPAK